MYLFYKQLKSNTMSKLKLNFATRVVARVAPKYQGDSGRSGEMTKVLAMTNAPETKVNLDKSIYAKTAEEKQELKNAKLKHKLNLKR